MTPVLLSMAGGTLLTIATIQTDDLFKAILLSVVGALSSFTAATFFSWLAKRSRKKK